MGNGNNTIVSTASWLLDPLYYATVELPALVDHLQYTNAAFRNRRDFHIVANSWGTMLSQLYLLNARETARKQRVTSMVLSGPFSDSQTYIQAQWDPIEGNLGTLPPFLQHRIRMLEKAQAYDSQEYQIINDVLSGKFTVRTQPAPDCWRKAEEQANMEIYTAMQGPSGKGFNFMFVLAVLCDSYTFATSLTSPRRFHGQRSLFPLIFVLFPGYLDTASEFRDTEA